MKTSLLGKALRLSVATMVLWVTASADSDPFRAAPATSHNFGSHPIPAGCFGPGSDPFIGNVMLGAAGGLADSVIQRMGSLTLSEPPPSFGDIPIEMVSLSLVSMQPMVVHYGGMNPQLWNAQCVLSASPPGIGGMTVHKTHANGGTFTGTLPVMGRFTFTRLDNPLLTAAPLIRSLGLSGSGSWSHTPPQGIPPGPGNFYPGGVPIDPTILNSVFYSGGGLNLELRLTVVPSAPFNITFVGETVIPKLPVNLPPGQLVLVARQIPEVATSEQIVGFPPAEGTTLYAGWL